MMASMRAIVVVCVAAAAAVVMGGTAWADSVAVTGAATGVTSSSAVLHGTVNPTMAGDTYTFQYSTESGPIKYSPTGTVSGTSSTQVSATVTGLMPDTFYAYRLVVTEGGYTQTSHTGNWLTFTTAPLPNTVATTGGATSITNTAANLNGVAHVTNTNSYWYFQYGTSTAYPYHTAPQRLGTGTTAVSWRITGLTPRMTYHYRLVVADTSNSPVTYHDGQDRTLITAAHAPPAVTYGTVSLASKKLGVKSGLVSIPVKCTGAKGAVCSGRFTLTTRHGGKTVTCATQRFSLGTSSRRRTVGARVKGACRALLASAGGHKLSATLRGTFNGGQRALTGAVTLVRS